MRARNFVLTLIDLKLHVLYTFVLVFMRRVDMKEVNNRIVRHRETKVNRLGWTVTAASFATHLVTDGIFYSFGLFLHEIVIYYDQPVAYIAWIFAIINGLSMLTGKYNFEMIYYYIVIV